MKPLKSTLAPIIFVFELQPLISPLAVPVKFPPPALVTTTASGSLPSLSLNCIAISYPKVSTPAIPKGEYKEALKYPVSSNKTKKV